MRRLFILVTLVCVLLDAYLGLPYGNYDLALFEIIAPLISAGAAALGFASNRDTNASNKAMTREQMAWQSEEAAINRDWQETMYNKYQSPRSQVQQLRAAGLNPALVFGQGQVGHFAGAQAGSVSGHAQQAWSPEAGFNGLSQALLNRYQPQMQREQVRSIELQNERAAIENRYIEEQKINELRESASRSNLSDKQREQLGQEIQYLEAVKDTRQKKEAQELQNAVVQEKLVKSQIEASQLAGELSKRADERAERQLKGDLAEGASRIALNAAMKGLTNEQKKHEIEKTAWTIVQKNRDTLGLPKAVNESEYELDKYGARHGKSVLSRVYKFLDNAALHVHETGVSVPSLPTILLKK